MKSVEIDELTIETPITDAFDRLAPDYDATWTGSLIGGLQRQAVWRYLDEIIRPGDRILDLGCGTGVDAVHLAQRGGFVHGVDASSEMITVARQRIRNEQLQDRITAQVLAIEDLGRLGQQRFDAVLSNFSPLNCVERLEPVAERLGRMVRPGGWLALCVMSRFCLWETLWYPLTGQLYKMARRWSGGRAAGSVGSDEDFPIYYPSVRKLTKLFQPDFRLERVLGIGVLVPPSYLEPLAQRFPRCTKTLARVDRVAAGWPLLRSMGDHSLVVLRRQL